MLHLCGSQSDPGCLVPLLLVLLHLLVLLSQPVQVVLIHGEADVKPASAGDGRGERLKAGERLVASNEVEKRDKPDLTHVLAWQTGYEMFDKETLARVAEEMNR